jgi:hypothetical protein
MENLKGRAHMGDLDVHGRIVLKWILKEIENCVEWIYLA